MKTSSKQPYNIHPKLLQNQSKNGVRIYTQHSIHKSPKKWSKVEFKMGFDSSRSVRIWTRRGRDPCLRFKMWNDDGCDPLFGAKMLTGGRFDPPLGAKLSSHVGPASKSEPKIDQKNNAK